jgi:hypothetical protein
MDFPNEEHSSIHTTATLRTDLLKPLADTRVAGTMLVGELKAIHLAAHVKLRKQTLRKAWFTH